LRPTPEFRRESSSSSTAPRNVRRHGGTGPDSPSFFFCARRHGRFSFSRKSGSTKFWFGGAGESSLAEAGRKNPITILSACPVLPPHDGLRSISHADRSRTSVLVSSPFAICRRDGKLDAFRAAGEALRAAPVVKPRLRRPSYAARISAKAARPRCPARDARTWAVLGFNVPVQVQHEDSQAMRPARVSRRHPRPKAKGRRQKGRGPRVINEATRRLLPKDRVPPPRPLQISP